MANRTDDSINEKIVEMRKKKSGIFTIFKWVREYANFKNLDKIIVLIHVLNILNKYNLAVSKNEVRNTFNRFYSRDFHGDKKSYLEWIYQNCKIKDGTLVRGSQIRNKPQISAISEDKSLHSRNISQNLGDYTIGVLEDGRLALNTRKEGVKK